MKKELVASITAVIPYWPPILCIGVVGVLGSNGFWPEFAVLGFIIMVLIMITIYGKITSVFVPGEPASARRILSENWLNYVAAVLILRVPQAAIRTVLVSRADSMGAFVFYSTLLGSVFGVLTMYVLPIVFLKKSSLAAVLAGIAYLFKNMAVSIWIACVVVMTYVLTTVGALVFRLETTPWSFVLALAASMTGLFLSFVTYVGALRVLAAGGKEKLGSPA